MTTPLDYGGVPHPVRVAIRGFADNKILFEDRVDLQEAELAELLPALAEKHGEAMAEHALHMIEIEFLDEANVNERFFRFGSDPSGMVDPLAVDLAKPFNIASVWPRKPS